MQAAKDAAGDEAEDAEEEDPDADDVRYVCIKVGRALLLFDNSCCLCTCTSR